MFNFVEKNTKDIDFASIDKMVFPTPDMELRAATDEEIAAANRLIDASDAPGMKEVWPMSLGEWVLFIMLGIAALAGFYIGSNL